MTRRVALIDYGSGNLRSAEKALARAAREGGAVQEIVVTADPGAVARAERIVLPGVGAFADCMRGLTSIPGMREALEEAVRARGVPFLGICVGMQLLATLGREFGETPGLGWIDGEVVALAPADPTLKIPHMGWNELTVRRAHPLFAGIEAGAHAYFVHSYQFHPEDDDAVLATADYGGPVTAAIGRDNIAGTQFHPEKSQAVGLRLLAELPELVAMILFPAIDLKDGACVRLKRGEMGEATIFNTDPAAQAQIFAAAGFEYLHCVDLNGAFEGHSANAPAIRAIRAAIDLPIQLGGGIRDRAGIEHWLEAGITRVILGTAALRNPGSGEGGRTRPSRPHRRRHRRQGRQGGGGGLGANFRAGCRRIWRGVSRMPASPPSSSPTSPATACWAASMSRPPRLWRTLFGFR